METIMVATELRISFKKVIKFKLSMSPFVKLAFNEDVRSINRPNY